MDPADPAGPSPRRRHRGHGSPPRRRFRVRLAADERAELAAAAAAAGMFAGGWMVQAALEVAAAQREAAAEPDALAVQARLARLASASSQLRETGRALNALMPAVHGAPAGQLPVGLHAAIDAALAAATEVEQATVDLEAALGRLADPDRGRRWRVAVRWAGQWRYLTRRPRGPGDWSLGDAAGAGAWTQREAVALAGRYRRTQGWRDEVADVELRPAS